MNTPGLLLIHCVHCVLQVTNVAYMSPRDKIKEAASLEEKCPLYSYLLIACPLEVGRLIDICEPNHLEAGVVYTGI